MTQEAVDKQAEWLDKHAVECKRYQMRLSPVACQQHQAADPEHCKGCERAQGDIPQGSRYGRNIGMFPVKKKAKETKVSKHRVAECGSCKRVMPLPGRGLCGKCYSAALKAEGKKDKPRHQVRSDEPLPTAGTIDQGHLPAMPSGLDWLFAGDDEMRAKIEAAAKKERRDVRQQVLFYLDQII